MQVIKHHPIEAPFAPAELKEIDAVLQGVRRRGLDWMDVTREDFPLPAFSSELKRNAASAKKT